MNAPVEQKRLSWKAITCIVCTLLTPILLPLAIPALVFGALSLRELREHAEHFARSRLIRTTRIVWWGLVVLTIAVPLCVGIFFSFRARVFGGRTMNEATAVSYTRQIRAALQKYSGSHGGYPPSMAELASAGLLPKERVTTEMNGYRYLYSPSQPVSHTNQAKPVFASFELSVTPRWNRITGKVALHLDEKGVIIIRESTDKDAPVFEFIK